MRLRLRRISILWLSTVIFASCALPAMPVSLHSPSTQSSASSIPFVTHRTSLPTVDLFSGSLLPVSLTASGVIELGLASAPATLREYFDYGCDYCREFLSGDFPQIEHDYLRTGAMKMQWVLLPMSDAGQRMALASFCALKHGQFWTGHEYLQAQTTWTESLLTPLAKRLKMSVTSLRSCMASKEAKTWLSTQQALGAKGGIERVPAFAIGSDHWLGILDHSELINRIDATLGK